MRLVLPLVLLVATLTDAHKILVYNSKYGHSHSNFMGRIADILAEAGHEVTSLIPILDEKVPDGTTKSKVIHVQPDPRAVEEAKATRKDMDFYSMDSFSIIAQLFVGRYLGKVFSYTCEKTLDEPGLIDRLREEKFDVMIAEHFDMCGLGMSHLIKPKAYIGASATTIMNHEFEEFGVPRSSSFNPGSYMTFLDVHSMWSRIKNIYAEFLINTFFADTRSKVEAVFKNRYGSEFPDFMKLSSHAAYVFTNSEPLIDFAVPTLSRIIPVGGLNAKDPKPLDETWTGILTKRPRTVLISFGSVVQSYMLPIDVKRSMLKTISAFPDVTFIWKYEKPEDEFATGEAAKVANLHLAKWQPQVDILNHPNLAVFVTHGGMGSTQETAMRGVPGVFIPFFGDQPRNAGMMHFNEFGIAIDKTDMGNAEKFTGVLRELLENGKYRNNAKRIAAMLAKKPFSSKQQLVKYTEFAAEFGPSSALRPQSHDMNWIEYHNVDIILALVLTSFGVGLLIIYILLKKIFGRSVEKKKSEMRLHAALFMLLCCGDAFKVLVYNSIFGHSHSHYMGRLADIIAGGGHNVTSLLSVINSAHSDGSVNSTKIVVKLDSETKKLLEKFGQVQVDLFSSNNYDPIGAYMFGSLFGATYAAQCKALLEEPGLIERLKAEKYDVLLAEHFDMCGVGLAEVIKPKSFISVSTCVVFGSQFDEYGIPNMPSFDPALATYGMNVHSIKDRFWNLYSSWLDRLGFYPFRTLLHSVFREKFGPRFPSFVEISSRSAYVFTNSEPLIDYATPTITKVVQLGGLGAKQPNKLSEEWESILGRREKTILLSFGTVVQSSQLPAAVKHSFLTTMKAFPDVTFIWKYETEDDFTKESASKVENLVLSKWTPQTDLLTHPKLAAFITHGGAGSTQETAGRGVPGIFIPLFGDQPRNAGMMRHNGLGKVISKYDITNPAKLIAVIKEVLSNDNYRKNAQRISAMLAKKPFGYTELIVKHVEFAAEFGPSPALRPQSYDMNWIEYHNVDIIVLGFVVLSTVLYLSTMVALRLAKFILTKEKMKSD